MTKVYLLVKPNYKLQHTYNINTVNDLISKGYKIVGYVYGRDMIFTYNNNNEVY